MQVVMVLHRPGGLAVRSTSTKIIESRAEADLPAEVPAMHNSLFRVGSALWKRITGLASSQIEINLCAFKRVE